MLKIMGISEKPNVYRAGKDTIRTLRTVNANHYRLKEGGVKVEDYDKLDHLGFEEQN